ncbi:hypothetical protein RYX36_012809 [Vicia faba]
MTANYVFDRMIQSISVDSAFNCGLFSNNESVFCWGDETSNKVISLIPLKMKFRMISAGGFHVCGILKGVNSRTFCWWRSVNIEEQVGDLSSNQALQFLVRLRSLHRHYIGGRKLRSSGDNGSDLVTNLPGQPHVDFNTLLVRSIQDNHHCMACKNRNLETRKDPFADQNHRNQKDMEKACIVLVKPVKEET